MAKTNSCSLLRMITGKMQVPGITVLILMVMQCISVVNCHPINEDQSTREPHTIVRFHDTLVRKNSIPGIRSKSNNKSRRSSSIAEGYRVLPADDSLHNKYYSGRVENNLGHAKINPRSKRQSRQQAPAAPPTSVLTASIQSDQFNSVQQPQSQPIWSQPQQKNPVMALFQPDTDMDKARMQDLAEIFRILARRDGFLLEQMLSLKDAIERYYGIFEFMGVSKLPASKRDPLIRKILEKGFKNEKERMNKV